MVFRRSKIGLLKAHEVILLNIQTFYKLNRINYTTLFIKLKVSDAFTDFKTEKHLLRRNLRAP